ncbi:MAG: hypothetical protein OXG25_01165, partial [Gammaproteobacteria bacterium]|nr:hypothetical protein [Gammaproteobacteria bacterium]
MAKILRTQLTECVIAQIALRTIHEIFQADRTEKVDLIWFKGYVKVTDQITGVSIFWICHTKGMSQCPYCQAT